MHPTVRRGCVNPEDEIQQAWALDGRALRAWRNTWSRTGRTSKAWWGRSDSSQIKREPALPKGGGFLRFPRRKAPNLSCLAQTNRLRRKQAVPTQKHPLFLAALSGAGDNLLHVNILILRELRVAFSNCRRCLLGMAKVSPANEGPNFELLMTMYLSYGDTFLKECRNI